MNSECYTFLKVPVTFDFLSARQNINGKYLYYLYFVRLFRKTRSVTCNPPPKRELYSFVVSFIILS